MPKDEDILQMVSPASALIPNEEVQGEALPILAQLGLPGPFLGWGLWLPHSGYAVLISAGRIPTRVSERRVLVGSQHPLPGYRSVCTYMHTHIHSRSLGPPHRRGHCCTCTHSGHVDTATPHTGPHF